MPIGSDPKTVKDPNELLAMYRIAVMLEEDHSVNGPPPEEMVETRTRIQDEILHRLEAFDTRAAGVLGATWPAKQLVQDMFQCVHIMDINGLYFFNSTLNMLRVLHARMKDEVANPPQNRGADMGAS